MPHAPVNGKARRQALPYPLERRGASKVDAPSAHKRKAQMRCLRYALPVLAAAAVLVPSAGHADPYRWCAEYSGGRDGGGGTNCGFVTLEQCRATISGIGGLCTLNPFYDGRPFDPERRHKRRTYGSGPRY
jgi:hypothetical protein